MADEAKAPVAAGAPKPVEEPTRPAEASEGTVVPEAKPAVGGDVATEVATAEDQAPKTAAAAEDQAAKDETTIDAKPDTTATGVDGSESTQTDAAPIAEASATNGTPAAKKGNNERRKSTGGGVREHKKKTPNKKKKMPELHLDTQPGDMWMVAMRGYQPWPVIICDEAMLPESLLSKRPVSAKRLDGTYREDFMEGGKNAKDRRYPVMFLGTNEFAWQVNTELLPFDIEEVKKVVEAGNNQKKNKSLWDAYVIAAEGHDLEYFKDMLSNHEAAMQEDLAAKERKAEEKAKKAAKRKSSAAEESEDVEMDDAGDDAAPSAKKAKASKKRKKEDDSEGEPEKPAKTPKTKLKLTNKPKDASAAKPKESKAKKAKSSEDEAEAAPAEEPPMTEEERLQKREKSVLYLRHRLQKGFLSRDQAPRDEDMPNMSGYLKQLEELEGLEAEVIRNTKVHKVLKAIIKLNTIPKEDEYNFKQRSNNLLSKWNTALQADNEPAGDAAPSASSAPTTNGVKHNEEKKTEEPTIDKPEEIPTTGAPKPTDGDGDISMADAKDEAPAVKDNAAPSAEATPAATETAAA